MLIFADQCVHTDVITALRESGHDVVRAAEVGLARAPDEKLFLYTKETSRVLLTFDKDFGNIRRFDIQTSYGIVIISVERMSRDRILRRAVAFFDAADAHALKGTLSLLGPEETRTWPTS